MALPLPLKNLILVCLNGKANTSFYILTLHFVWKDFAKNTGLASLRIRIPEQRRVCELLE